MFAEMAVESVARGLLSFCKFLSANDTGETNAHQAGIYISKPAISILFDSPGERGTNKERWVRIKWQHDCITDTRFIYYGQGSRNEYRITNFGRNFPFLKAEYTGALFVLVKISEEDYEGFVLNTDDEINYFLDSLGITPADTNRLIDRNAYTTEEIERSEIARYIALFNGVFPETVVMSRAARRISDAVMHRTDYLIGNDLIIEGQYTSAKTNPDHTLIEWTRQEYRLFRSLENSIYREVLSKGFSDVETFVSLASEILNRRKSRAGKGLEHHLAALFDSNSICYTEQAKTEGAKRPDFIFPSESAYHNPNFPSDHLVSLAAKTTCKDRWRQVLNEADRLRDGAKYLCTLQQGISRAQMDEMKAENVVLVVPQPYITTYPKDRQDRIWTVQKFISYVKSLEA